MDRNFILRIKKASELVILECDAILDRQKIPAEKFIDDMDRTARKEIGIRIKAFRCRLGFTQQNLAEKSFSTQGVLSKVESGESELPPELAARLVEIFGCEKEDLGIS